VILAFLSSGYEDIRLDTPNMLSLWGRVALFNTGRKIGQRPSAFPLLIPIDAATSGELGLHAQADAFGRSVDDEVVGVTAGSSPLAVKHGEADK
jgi:hypothetical protein